MPESTERLAALGEVVAEDRGCNSRYLVLADAFARTLSGRRALMKPRRKSERSYLCPVGAPQ